MPAVHRTARFLTMRYFPIASATPQATMRESTGRFSSGSHAMLQLESKKAVPLCDGMSRRDFLRVGSLSAGAIGLSLADYYQLQRSQAANLANDVNCILLF